MATTASTPAIDPMMTPLFDLLLLLGDGCAPVGEPGPGGGVLGEAGCPSGAPEMEDCLVSGLMMLIVLSLTTKSELASAGTFLVSGDRLCFQIVMVAVPPVPPVP